jgi:hypothetical protein
MWTPDHIRQRLSFAEAYAWMSYADWERVIFSDETHVELSPHGQMWVQRPVGAEHDPQYVVPRRLHSDRVTLWGCFCAKEIGQAEIFVGEFDAAKYVDVLRHTSFPPRAASFPQACGGSNRTTHRSTPLARLESGFTTTVSTALTFRLSRLTSTLSRICGQTSSVTSSSGARARWKTWRSICARSGRQLHQVC